jgi:YVTN family beta-propeller protein
MVLALLALPAGLAICAPFAYVTNAGSHDVSVIDTSTNAVIAVVPVGDPPITSGQFMGPAAGTSSPSMAPDLNQHGLTGSWFEPATIEQGFEIEVFPDLMAAGTGFAQLSWFTFDTVAGGANRQRWYTASCAFAPGSRSIPVDIFEATGGVFDAPSLPAPTSTKVGSGTLAFQSCSTGTFSYIFTGGSSSGSSGTIALNRVGPVPKGCTLGTTQPACAQIGGTWNIAEDVTLACSGAFGSGTVTQSGTSSTTITQTGCNFSFPSPLGTASTARTGTVTGNTIQATGPMAVDQAGLVFSQNRIEFSGTVTADVRRIDTTGVGTVTGTYQGYPGECTASTKEAWTR